MGQVVTIHFPSMAGEAALTVRPKLSSHVKFTLGTARPEVAKARKGLATAQLATFYDGLRNGPARLEWIQIRALAGEVRAEFIRKFHRDPGEPEVWEAWKAFNRAVAEGRIERAPVIDPDVLPNAELDPARATFGADLTAGIDRLPKGQFDLLETRFGELATASLTRRGIGLVDPQCRKRLLICVANAATEAGWQLKRNAMGDYSPDTGAEKYPAFTRATDRPDAVSLTEIFDRWKAEAKPAASTLTTWVGVMKALRSHVGHEEAGRITTEMLIEFKDVLLAKGLKPKTVQDTYLAALRSVFSYAVTNRLLGTNPAASVKVAQRKKAGEGRLPYSDDEVARLLALAEEQTNAAKRWIIPLCALSGARVGEIAQLWGRNVQILDGTPCMRLTPAPDGGSLKNAGSERTVPIHSGLVAAGFLDFVKRRGDGPLFYAGTGRTRRTNEDPKRHASKGVTNRIASWIRDEGFSDPRKAPAHALRHWFKTTAARAGVEDSVADTIQGHAISGDAGVYRHLRDDIRTLAAAIEKIQVMSTAKSLERGEPPRILAESA
jgi:integrase